MEQIFSLRKQSLVIQANEDTLKHTHTHTHTLCIVCFQQYNKEFNLYGIQNNAPLFKNWLV